MDEEGDEDAVCEEVLVAAEFPDVVKLLPLELLEEFAAVRLPADGVVELDVDGDVLD